MRLYATKDGVYRFALALLVGVLLSLTAFLGIQQQSLRKAQQDVACWENRSKGLKNEVNVRERYGNREVSGVKDEMQKSPNGEPLHDSNHNIDRAKQQIAQELNGVPVPHCE